MPPSPELSPAEIVRSDLCIGCGACTLTAADSAMRWDRDGFRKPAGAFLGRPSRAVAERCPMSPAAANEDMIATGLFPAAQDFHLGRTLGAWIGHVAEGEWRAQGSSGGLTSWVAGELLRTGKVDAVAHVVPEAVEETGRFFGYRLSRSLGELSAGAQSRYYPVDLAAVLREIAATRGRYAIVGVPCFIKAVQLARRADPVLAERITHTLGLFCGHQKSAHMVDSFAIQLDAPMREVRAVDYRKKDPGRPANWYRADLALADGSHRAGDWMHLADGDWGAGYWQNPACDWCDDVVAETADISFGDAWIEPHSSDGRGTNVVVVRSPALHAMIESARANGRLALEPCANEMVVKTQAAGFRHRRQGLAYRLTWAKRGLRPVKRVTPSAALPLRRKAIYRLRRLITRMSHLMFRVARRTGRPGLAIAWAKPALQLYQAIAWGAGSLGRWIDRIAPRTGA
ncbi:Coenzyme F420 hydrogenase/dehydrogenase, beta subunit C-terminal domain [Sphingomonas sp. LHG3406-1]|uniref:Coenzyme F420 hydrogenase/dehydrogenase, beta subunit C-terminal domain n=1 Tax=Sphingomonas sp. LHG3406-1 TaxID=2804617 RepID=UPI00260AD08B|nr:Coenzyme F420 hydrogenase/dehydrogenase, beta subunit C-terminal domain [Sphingomonas sp. LHG3406-1]